VLPVTQKNSVRQYHTKAAVGGRETKKKLGKNSCLAELHRMRKIFTQNCISRTLSIRLRELLHTVPVSHGRFFFQKTNVYSFTKTYFLKGMMDIFFI
jgi:hypothetical protein